MNDFDNRGRFSLWKNTNKRPDKQDADYTGTFVDEEGHEYWVNAWPKKQGQSDKAPVLSGTIRRKQGGAQQQSNDDPF